jgi:DNA-binding response OmpR family regulator
MNKSNSILIIEDHADIIEILKYNLAREGYELYVATDGMQGVKEAREKRPSLILLDLMLPKMDGTEVCKLLKSKPETSTIPIIMLTAKGEESDVVLGLGIGADDYVVKPFSPKELVARIKSVLRRSQEQVAALEPENDVELIKIGALTIDSRRHQVSLKKEVLALTLAEFNLLKTLAQNRGRVFTRDQLLEKVCGPDITVVDRNIDVHVASLRKKLKSMGEMILTVRGVGYRFQD